MTFLYLNSDKMGEGDPELGKKLLVIFLHELMDANGHIDVIGCVNSGINLTTEGSPVLDLLHVFERRGTKIVTCKTCLDYLDRNDQLRVGEVGTMAQTVITMLKADKVIRPH